MTVLQPKSPGRCLPALHLDFRIINVVTRPAGLNIVSQHRFLRPVTVQYPAQLHAQILTRHCTGNPQPHQLPSDGNRNHWR